MSTTRIAIALSILVLSACVARQTQAPADLVFHAGLVYTVDRDRPRAEAVAVRDGKIAYVGDEQGLAPWIGPETERVEIGKGMLLPGFHDSHNHPMAAGTRVLRCDLEGRTWPAGVLEALRRCASELGAGEWLRGTNLTAQAFHGTGPDKRQLDAITGDRPALIQSIGNPFWANSAALEMAGIDDDTPEPEFGRIVRRPGSSEPSGLLDGEAANEIYRLLPIPGEAALQRSLEWASRQANAFGIVSSNESAARPELVAAFISVAQRGDLTRLRLQVAQRWDRDRGLEQLDEIMKAAHASDDPMLNLRSVKLFLDGDSAHQDAALLRPYASGGLGALNYEDESLFQIVRRLDEAGLDVHFHAWGDRAVRQALDAVEQAIAVNPAWDRRHQVAHLGLVDPDDLPRFAALGVTADVQPLWAYLDDERRSLGQQLDAERAGRLIPIRSLFDAGARVVAGSDWISESMNPLVAIRYAVTRQKSDGSDAPWNPAERAGLEQMLEAYTINGAWLARQENVTGSIEEGKAADLVLLDRNLFELAPYEIARARVRMTLVNGEVVYRQGFVHDGSVE
ncbi:MAG: amidohydrolase family protein [Xanthomonadales bacterium]|nr:amidohydrolase family protein [Xanthomonadales bacterium]